AGDWLRWFRTNPSGTRASAERAFRAIVSAPGHGGEYYDAGCRCIRDRNDRNRLVIESPRYRALPLFDPGTFNGASNQNLEVVGFAGVFVESVSGSSVTVRVLPIAGTGTAVRHPGPLVKRVALVE
ncbi:MAG: hypothetical protein R3266_02985, partial [Gemmatimonadota bacterium]|nr:hypothetical protein [Gemmatimonadota bacterium]